MKKEKAMKMKKGGTARFCGGTKGRTEKGKEERAGDEGKSGEKELGAVYFEQEKGKKNRRAGEEAATKGKKTE